MSRILLVEDTLDLAQLISRELEAEGYEVVRAADGASALAKLSSVRPDLLILDWMLPKLSGLDVLCELRKGSAIPVLMLTARHEEADRVIGLEMGADDYLTKPFSMRELIARVRALLRRIEHVQQVLAQDRQGEAGVIRYAALTLDPATFQTMLEGVEDRVDAHRIRPAATAGAPSWPRL